MGNSSDVTRNRSTEDQESSGWMMMTVRPPGFQARSSGWSTGTDRPSARFTRKGTKGCALWARRSWSDVMVNRGGAAPPACVADSVERGYGRIVPGHEFGSPLCRRGQRGLRWRSNQSAKASTSSVDRQKSPQPCPWPGRTMISTGAAPAAAARAANDFDCSSGTTSSRSPWMMSVGGSRSETCVIGGELSPSAAWPCSTASRR